MEINRANICIDCNKACGGCSWSEVDPLTDQIRYEPVPGWTAEPVYKRISTNGSGKKIVDTYRITACPLFEGDDYKVKHDMTYLSESESDWFLKNVRNILKRWADE